ncbi:helix-turn-helix domain-containing protein [Erythrobacter sp.]|uniref:helix-turn-helix domain-containing protein n=1 Tax=Erythrobacter sp. TaxID=1042 RepID=UPI003C77EB6C
MPWPILRILSSLESVTRVSGINDPNEILQRIGRAIRELRTEAGLSQEALADASSIDRSHLGRIERGERNLSVLNLARIARALNLSGSGLLEIAAV